MIRFTSLQFIFLKSSKELLLRDINLNYNKILKKLRTY